MCNIKQNRKKGESSMILYNQIKPYVELFCGGIMVASTITCAKILGKEIVEYVKGKIR
jgi:hypothetical protein